MPPHPVISEEASQEDSKEFNIESVLRLPVDEDQRGCEECSGYKNAEPKLNI